MSTPPRFLATLYTLILALFFLLVASLAHTAAPIATTSGSMDPPMPASAEASQDPATAQAR